MRRGKENVLGQPGPPKRGPRLEQQGFAHHPSIILSPLLKPGAGGVWEPRQASSLARSLSAPHRERRTREKRAGHDLEPGDAHPLPHAADISGVLLADVVDYQFHLSLCFSARVIGRPLARA